MEEVKKKVTARLTFRDGRDNAMVSTLREAIDGKYADYVVVANANHQIKAGVEYQVELIEMKSKKGFIVTSAKAVRDALTIRIKGDCVYVYVKPFGSEVFEGAPRFMYDRRDAISVDSAAWRITNAVIGCTSERLNVPSGELKTFIDDFKVKCKAMRAGAMNVEIIDEPLCKVEENDVINIYLRRSYETEFGKTPIACYDANERGWEPVRDELDNQFAQGKIIMPVEDFDAFIEGFISLSKKREQEKKKEIIKSISKRVPFKKPVKPVEKVKHVEEAKPLISWKAMALQQVKKQKFGN